MLGWLAGLTAVAGLLGWLAPTLAPGAAITDADTDIARFVAERRTDAGVVAMRVVTTAGDLWFVAALVVVLGTIAVLRTRQWRPLWLPAMAGAGALVISVTVKLATGRARPAAPLATVEAVGDAFPSGHALRAMAVYAALAWLVAAAGRGAAAQLAAWGAAAATILMVGASRVYLGAHWLTDVLAGYVLGAVWVLVLIRTVSLRSPPLAEITDDSWTGQPTFAEPPPAP